MSTYKPNDYNSVSPYLLVTDVSRYIELLQAIFGVTTLRMYKRVDGSINHVELRLDDSIIMLSEATEEYPPLPTMLHVYVPDVQATFDKAIEAGCVAIEAPKQSDEDPDMRGMFQDYVGTVWAVGTQSTH